MYIFSLQKGDGSLCVAIQCMTYTKAAVIAQETWGSIIPQVDLLLVVSWGYSKSPQFGDNFWSKGRRRSNQTIWYSPAFSCIKPSVLVSTEWYVLPGDLVGRRWMLGRADIGTTANKTHTNSPFHTQTPKLMS